MQNLPHRRGSRSSEKLVVTLYSMGAAFRPPPSAMADAIEVRQVDVFTLTEVLESHVAETIDFLKIDAEGWAWTSVAFARARW
jgi:Methyltransferase FkbM domain